MSRYERRGLRTIMLMAALALLGVSVGGCGPEGSETQADQTTLRPPSVPDSMTIPRTLETDARFSTLRAALDSTGLDSLLATDGPFTLFAPPNEAFEALPPGTMEGLLSENRERLRAILSQHIVTGRVPLQGDSGPGTIVPRTGDTLSVSRTQEGFRVGTTPVLDTNIEAANGLVHVIDGVLPPPSTDSQP